MAQSSATFSPPSHRRRRGSGQWLPAAAAAAIPLTDDWLKQLTTASRCRIAPAGTDSFRTLTYSVLKLWLYHHPYLSIAAVLRRLNRCLPLPRRYLLDHPKEETYVPLLGRVFVVVVIVIVFVNPPRQEKKMQARLFLESNERRRTDLRCASVLKQVGSVPNLASDLGCLGCFG